MKNTIILLAFFGFFASSWAQSQIKIVTVIESIIPMGMGRSRIIESIDTVNSSLFTTTRTEGKKSKQDQVDRDELKIDNFSETKILNFYSGVGINFQNIASNDAIVTSRLLQLMIEGWKLSFVVGGVESNAGKDDGDGLFLTRYILTK